MRKFLLASTALLLGASSAFSQATTSLNVTVPGSGTAFSFDSAVGSTPPYSPLIRLWDETNKMVINPNGQASVANGQPVTLPAVQVSADPCTLQKKTQFTTTSSNTASTQLIALVSLNTIYICSVVIKVNSATAFSLLEGTGSNCATAQVAVVGSTTAANGIPFSGIGDGLAMASGNTVWSTLFPGDALCFAQSVAEAVSITIAYVQTQL